MVTWKDEHAWEYEQEEALEKLIEDAFVGRSENSIRATLSYVGDVYWDRAALLLRQAQECHRLGYEGASLTLAAAAIEVTVRFLILRPLIDGAFLSDVWAAILTDRMTSGRSAEDREMLPAVLRQWHIDVTTLTLPDGRQFWQTVVSTLWPKRNQFIHGGTPIDAADAEAAIECVEVIRRDILCPISERLGLPFHQKGKWRP